MKGFKYIQKERIHDMTPCFFCKHWESDTNSPYCYDCIDTVDLALHKDNAKTEFACFEAMSEEHLKVLNMEQKG